MTAAAEVACYVQPVTGVCKAAAVAWIDTSKTAVLRRRVSSAAEAANVIAEARAVAVALGGGMAIKTVVVTAWDADRAPSGVKRLQGTRIVEAAR
jgi:aminoglycoside phosphotransferase